MPIIETWKSAFIDRGTMQDVESDDKRFLQELETEVQTGEERARKSKKALKQGTEA